MQGLIFTALVPHPPILIEAVGQGETAHVRITITAMQQLASELVGTKPDVVVIISPHGPVFHDAIAVHLLPEISGDLGALSAPEVAFQLPIDQALGNLVVEAGRRAGLSIAPVTPEWAVEWLAEKLDHGTVVPLQFLRAAGWDGPILPIAMGMLPPVSLYAFGQALQEAIDQSGRRIAVLASGDLSHRLAPEAPAGYHPDAQRFDREVVEALGRGDLEQLFRLDPDLVELAGECGLRPLMMLAGVLDGIEVNPQVLSYQGPFGVGYAVVALRPGGAEPSRHLRPQIESARRERVERSHEQAHPVVQVARVALEHFVRTGMLLDFSASAPDGGTTSIRIPPEMPDRAGLFVSLKLDGDLRGCMGTSEPTEPSLLLEIVQNAIQAGTADPRFDPVDEEDLPFLTYTVDILAPAEPCTIADLDPHRYGVIVTQGELRGLLLPDLAGIDEPEDQVAIACRKAGITATAGIQLARFGVIRLK
jgi:AmmeMemoRadiSam system protein A/AmmeMemoRadiSam system protein B